MRLVCLFADVTWLWDMRPCCCASLCQRARCSLLMWLGSLRQGLHGQQCQCVSWNEGAAFSSEETKYVPTALWPKCSACLLLEPLQQLLSSLITGCIREQQHLPQDMQLIRAMRVHSWLNKSVAGTTALCVHAKLRFQVELSTATTEHVTCWESCCVVSVSGCAILPSSWAGHWSKDTCMPGLSNPTCHSNTPSPARSRYTEQ